MALVPKRSTAGGPLDQRPITMTNMGFRLWPGTRARQSSLWVKQWAHPRSAPDPGVPKSIVSKTGIFPKLANSATTQLYSRWRRRHLSPQVRSPGRLRSGPSARGCGRRSLHSPPPVLLRVLRAPRRRRRHLSPRLRSPPPRPLGLFGPRLRPTSAALAPGGAPLGFPGARVGAGVSSPRRSDRRRRGRSGPSARGSGRRSLHLPLAGLLRVPLTPAVGAGVTSPRRSDRQVACARALRPAAAADVLFTRPRRCSSGFSGRPGLLGWRCPPLPSQFPRCRPGRCWRLFDCCFVRRSCEGRPFSPCQNSMS
jgi:hypothetical protein